MAQWGIDFASVDGNKPVDFQALKQAGASFVWIRGSFVYAGAGVWHNTPDPVLARDWTRLATSGMVRGTYMFPVLQASQSPIEQVATLKRAVDAAGGLRAGIDLPPCLDIEFPGRGIASTGLDRAGVMAWLRTAIAELRRVFGVPPILYTSGRVWNDSDADCLNNPPAPDLVECPLWLARYPYATRLHAIIPPPMLAPPPVPRPWGDCWWAHQYQGDALGVPGVSNTADLNRFRGAKQGDKGGHVAWIQNKLSLKADGIFGPNTENAVRAFQLQTNRTVDGMVGIGTFAGLCWL
jgi:peptidoglycan hydrolase-like protein with peptidoglycan-binding domain